ncbi:MAG TPA: hypothetical protein VHL30_02785 [Chlamydiales bacterium]|jgi:hypothetical protein|nr:hypothetical protein [Chlamydiales bacterium]
MDSKKDSLIAALESKIDMLETELDYLNKMLVECGFPEGIKTLKMTVQELLEEDGIIEHRSSQEI